MKITLTHEESEKIFHDALCNSLGYIQGHGLVLECSEEAYDTARKNTNIPSPCYEDVLMQILKDGGTLTLVDLEGVEEAADITLIDVHNRVELAEPHHLLDAITQNGDVETGDCILQTVFLGEMIYG